MVRATGTTLRVRMSTSSKIGSTMWTSPALAAAYPAVATQDATMRAR